MPIDWTYSLNGEPRYDSVVGHRIIGTKVVMVNGKCEAATYVGQVERDPAGTLWAVLYHRDQVIERERVRSLRHGKRRVTTMVLAASDAFPDDPRRPVPVPLNRIPTDQPTVGRHRLAAAGQLAAAGRSLAI